MADTKKVYKDLIIINLYCTNVKVLCMLSSKDVDFCNFYLGISSATANFDNDEV
jgi:hypothetical protein